MAIYLNFKVINTSLARTAGVILFDAQPTWSWSPASWALPSLHKSIVFLISKKLFPMRRDL